VDPGAVVRDSIIMFDTVIRAGAVVDHAIIDKEVSIGPNAVVGHGADMATPNRSEPERLNTGITVVGKRAVVPTGVRLGRNVRIGERVRAADYGGRRSIASGGTVEARSEDQRGAAGKRARSERAKAEEVAERELPMSARGGRG
jgi:glucose-1-phosphate adenylyltransferase